MLQPQLLLMHLLLFLLLVITVVVVVVVVNVLAVLHISFFCYSFDGMVAAIVYLAQML